MPLKLYMDHHVPRAITIGLRLRQVDVITAYEDQAHEMSDPTLLDRATALGRILFTQDDDLLTEATRRQQARIDFNGIIYGHQQDVSIGQCIRDLELITVAGFEAEIANQIIYLPL